MRSKRRRSAHCAGCNVLAHDVSADALLSCTTPTAARGSPFHATLRSQSSVFFSPRRIFTATSWRTRIEAAVAAATPLAACSVARVPPARAAPPSASVPDDDASVSAPEIISSAVSSRSDDVYRARYTSASVASAASARRHCTGESDFDADVAADENERSGATLS